MSNVAQRTSRRHAVAAARVFDGMTLHANMAVVIEGAEIATLMPRAALPADIAVVDLPQGAWLAPGFIDLQVNGGGDVLFNDDPTPQVIAAIAAAHRRFGTTALLPTLITDTPAKMRAALEAVDAVMDTEPGVLGLHLEGPFLSREKAGIHDPGLIRSPTADDEALLCAARQGQLLVTLAPEAVPDGFVARLVEAGIHVALGHSMATYAQTRAAVAQGLGGFTHLFNAMRPLASREPGPIAAALELRNVWYSLIVDGAHVDPAMLRLALRGAGQPILVTDAMPPVGGRRSAFMLNGREITARGGRCIDAHGTLAGAVLHMADAVRNCVELLGVPLTQALRLASAAPAAVLGLDRKLGRLAPGYRADMVAFAPQRLDVLATWVAGRNRTVARALPSHDTGVDESDR
jgi:N-acetylglucosamine-6-phosphate deacetylase